MESTVVIFVVFVLTLVSSKSFKNATNSGDPPPPASLDYRAFGYVTPVVDQGQIDQSVFLATVGTVESCYAKRNGSLIPMSIQQLVDCPDSTRQQSLVHLILYLVQAGGMESAADYPSTGQRGSCKFDIKRVTPCIGGFYACGSSDEECLQALLWNYGPVAVLVNADDFRTYTGGIYSNPNCPSGKGNHAMLVVGYGTEGGQDYWILKNSWGVNWGEEGYLRLVRNVNLCGVADKAIIALIFDC